MKKELELFLRNDKIVSQANCVVERNPFRFMRNGLWCTEYTIHLNTYVTGLSLKGKITHYENEIVETELVFSTYGEYHLSHQDLKRREKIISYITKHGATFLVEPPVRWFN